MGQKIIGYIRISTDKQDLDKQRHLLLEYARKQRLIIDEFIEVEVSSRQDMGADELMNCNRNSKREICFLLRN